MTHTAFHVISRFVAGEWFIETDHERNAYLNLLGDALESSDWTCVAYAVMSNHIHLAMVAGSSARTAWLRNTHSPFGQWINERRERFGAVFAKGIVQRSVPQAELASVVAYIHNNPVRAGIEVSARDSTWTSHRAYLNLCSGPEWLDVDLGYRLMQIDAPDAFDRFVDAESSRPRTSRAKRGRPAGAARDTKMLRPVSRR